MLKHRESHAPRRDTKPSEGGHKLTGTGSEKNRKEKNMAIEKRKHPTQGWVWYSTLAGFWSESQLHAQDEENKEIHRRKCNTQDAIAAEFAKVPLDEIRRLDKEQHQQEAAEQAAYEQRRIAANFVRDNSSWYTNDLYNRDLINKRIEALLQANGRHTPGETMAWTEQDFHQALDSLGDEGVLHTHGAYQRQGPDVNAMTTDELRQLATDQLSGHPPPRR
jgi:hypothetical protein